MSWIIHNREAAEAAGADLEGTEVLFAITPDYIAEVYNRLHNNMEDHEEGYEDLWDQLPPETRAQHIRAVEGFINKRLSNTDEDIEDCIRNVEGHLKEDHTHA